MFHPQEVEKFDLNSYNMSNDLAKDILNDLKGYNWEINEIEDLAQSDCNHNCLPTPDLDIKIEIYKVDLTKEEDTHNKPEPLTSKAATSLRRISRVRNPNRHKQTTAPYVTSKRSTTKASLTSIQTTTPSTSHRQEQRGDQRKC